MRVRALCAFRRVNPGFESSQNFLGSVHTNLSLTPRLQHDGGNGKVHIRQDEVRSCLGRYNSSAAHLQHSIHSQHVQE